MKLNSLIREHAFKMESYSWLLNKLTPHSVILFWPFAIDKKVSAFK